MTAKCIRQQFGFRSLISNKLQETISKLSFWKQWFLFVYVRGLICILYHKLRIRFWTKRWLQTLSQLRIRGCVTASSMILSQTENWKLYQKIKNNYCEPENRRLTRILQLKVIQIDKLEPTGSQMPLETGNLVPVNKTNYPATKIFWEIATDEIITVRSTPENCYRTCKSASPLTPGEAPNQC